MLIKNLIFWEILSVICKFYALTLVFKHGIKSAARIFKKYNRNLKVKNKLGQNILELAYPTFIKN